MYCGKLIKDVWVFDPALAQEAKHAESFLILEGEPHEAAQFVGLLKVQPSNMASLIDWLRPGMEDEYVLLLSLDGKRGLIYPRTAVLEPDDKEVFWMPFDGHYHPYEVSRIIRDFKNVMRFETKLAEQIGYVQALNPQKKRVRFTGVGADVRSGDIDRDIQKAMRSLESATDDSLVWLAIAGPNNQNAMYPFSYAEVMREIAMRQSKGMEFRSTFFPLNRVSIEEIEQRQIRAELLHRVFKQKFHVEFGGIDFEKAIAWIRTLDTDMLGELAVYTYYSDAGRMGDWKYFVTEFQGRMKRTIIY